MGDRTQDVDISDHLDVLMSEWESLQNDIRSSKKDSHRRIVRGIIVMAAVAGYGLQTSNRWLFGFIPIIIGLIFMIHVQETNHIYYRNYKCCKIEDKIQQFNIDEFDWANEFGPLMRPNKAAPGGLTCFEFSARQLPSGATYSLGLFGYVFFIVYTTWLLRPQGDVVAPDQIPAVDSHLVLIFAVVLFYIIFTLLLVGVGIVNLRIRRKLHSEMN